MHFLEYSLKKNIKYDLINKFNYNKSKELPLIKKIILNFGCKTTKIKNLSSSLLALELISEKNARLTVTKKPNIILKIKKGNPVGCRVILTKHKIFYFLERNINEIFLNIKFFNKCKFKQKNLNFFSYKIYDPFVFHELGKNYYLFNDLTSLDITFVLKSSINKELVFILKSLKFLSKQI